MFLFAETLHVPHSVWLVMSHINYSAGEMRVSQLLHKRAVFTSEIVCGRKRSWDEGGSVLLAEKLIQLICMLFIRLELSTLKVTKLVEYMGKTAAVIKRRKFARLNS